MQLFVMRHGQAHHAGNVDSQRELTQQGFVEAKVMGNWLQSQQAQFSKVLVSPYERAQQTATTVVSNMLNAAPLTTIDFITPSGCAADVHDFLDGLCQNDEISSILLVSHMPFVSYLVAELTHDSHAPIFQTGAIAHIDYDVKKMTGQLIKLVSPSDII